MNLLTESLCVLLCKISADLGENVTGTSFQIYSHQCNPHTPIYVCKGMKEEAMW